jgi:hypothetical protein
VKQLNFLAGSVKVANRAMSRRWRTRRRQRSVRWCVCNVRFGSLADIVNFAGPMSPPSADWCWHCSRGSCPSSNDAAEAAEDNRHSAGFEDLAKIGYTWLYEPTRAVADAKSLWAFARLGAAGQVLSH